MRLRIFLTARLFSPFTTRADLPPSQLVGRDAGSNSSAGCNREATISPNEGLLCSSSSERPRPCTLPRVGRGQVHRLLSIVFLVQRGLQLASRGAVRLRHPCLPVRSGRCLGDLGSRPVSVR